MLRPMCDRPPSRRPCPPQQNFSTDPSLYIPLFALCTISLITGLIVKILTDCMLPKLLAHWKALAYIWCLESQCLQMYRRSPVCLLKKVTLEKPMPQYLHLYSRSLVCLLKNVTLEKLMPHCVQGYHRSPACSCCVQQLVAQVDFLNSGANG